MNSSITISVPLDHTKGVTVSVNGCPGPTCKDLTDQIEKALGKVVDDTKTEEFYQTPQQAHNHLNNFGG